MKAGILVFGGVSRLISRRVGVSTTSREEGKRGYSPEDGPTENGTNNEKSEVFRIFSLIKYDVLLQKVYLIIYLRFPEYEISNIIIATTQSAQTFQKYGFTKI